MTYKKGHSEKKNAHQDPFLDGRKGSLKDRLKYLASVRTTRETAELWGISTATLNAYINKGTEPSITRAKKICEAENVTLEWLTTGEDTPRTPLHQAHDDKSASNNGIESKLLAAIRDLPPEMQYKLYMRLITKGANSLDLNEAQDRWAALVADLDTQAEREIFAFAKKAKYMWLAGVPFNTPADIDQWNERRA